MNNARYKRGEITLKILRLIKRGLYATDELFEIFLGDPTATPYRRLLGIKRYRRPLAPTQEELENKERQLFYNLLWKLQKQGLVEKRKRSWFITKKGEEREALILGRWKIELPSRKYESEKSNALKLVIFDVPERERRKRFWLRSALLRMDFERLQKSVWIGKVKIPEEFLEDLRRLNLLPYIEIFAITKTGSLRAIE